MLQHTWKSIPEAIAKKVKSAELADVESLEEKESNNPLKIVSSSKWWLGSCRPIVIGWRPGSQFRKRSSCNSSFHLKPKPSVCDLWYWPWLQRLHIRGKRLQNLPKELSALVCEDILRVVYGVLVVRTSFCVSVLRCNSMFTTKFLDLLSETT